MIFRILASEYCGHLNFAILQKKGTFKTIPASQVLFFDITKHISEVSLLVTKIYHLSIVSSHYVPLAGWLFVNLTNLKRVLLGTFQVC